MPYFPIVPCSAVTEYRQTFLNSSVHLISQNEYRLMASSSPAGSKVDDQSSSHGRPSEEQLQAVFEHLSKFVSIADINHHGSSLTRAGTGQVSNFRFMTTSSRDIL